MRSPRLEDDTPASWRTTRASRTAEIERGIGSIEKQIGQHESWIKRPHQHIPEWDKLDPRQQDALLNRKWPSDIQCQQEQLEILPRILESRGCDVMSDERTARFYLRDLGQLLKEKARDAKLERDSSVGGDDQDLSLGRLMALHEVISLMLDQAVAFGIDPNDLSLGDIDPERDLT